MIANVPALEPQTAPDAATEDDTAIAVRVEGLSKSFPVDRTWSEALRHPMARPHAQSLTDVSFSVRTGEFFGLLGPNGAGKTTLFKLLGTALLPDAGTASINGHDLLEDTDAVRASLTSVLANERSVNWRLSAIENLRMFAAMYRIFGADAQRRIEEVLEIVQLSDVGAKLVANYSSGMRQRLLIARALLASPSVLLLDEPTRSLDPISARGFRDFLREMCARHKVTVLLATHSPDEALHLCDRVGVLHRGVLLVAGSPESLLRRYGDERYRVWTTEPERALTAIRARAATTVSGESTRDEEAGWWWLELQLQTGSGQTAAAALVEMLVREGISVGRFERVSLSLADLIERIVQARAA
ncbi:MAG: ABC transporter ATP-binding protein [Gemmatimonadota bacterium]|nr:ABC transporter ATP-binding protein [Gemmatimonadota bacterium]